MLKLLDFNALSEMQQPNTTHKDAALNEYTYKLLHRTLTNLLPTCAKQLINMRNTHDNINQLYHLNVGIPLSRMILFPNIEFLYKQVHNLIPIIDPA